jgi:hypothetical protein
MSRKAGASVYRVDINGQFRQGDAALAELLEEAEARGVSLQQHIYDLLRARYLARRGQAIADLLWTPGAPPPAAVEPPAPEPSAAGAAAAAWMLMQDE